MAEWLYLASWVFLLGGFAGVVLESSWAITIERRRRFEPRAGILSLPLNPLYGAGAVLGSFALGSLAHLPVVVFLVGAAVFSAIEYVASLVLERAFGSVFWDYSERPFNLNGRICLEFAFYWGLLSLGLVYAAEPALRSVIDLIPRPAGDVLAATLLAATTAATIATTAGFARLRERVAERIAGRSEDPQSVWERVADMIAPPAEMLAAFPRMNLSARYRRLLAESSSRDRSGRELTPGTPSTRVEK